MLRGQFRPRVDGVTFDIATGATAIVGYSGAGKTSLLNLLTRFERPDAGRIDFSACNAQDRLPLYWVPQDGGLWPHLTVLEHAQSVAPGGVVEESLRGLIQEFDLDERIDERPERLSEGERSRLSVIRALASQAAVLVMDEPLLNVDPARLPKYWKSIRRHCEQTETSLVMATHDPQTVLREAAHVVCLQDGRVMYAGDVADLYHSPSTQSLAEFLGPTNWMSTEAANRWLETTESVPRCLRPEQIQIAPSENGRLLVKQSVFSGALAEVELLDESTEESRKFLHRPASATLQVGDRVSIKMLVMLMACLLLAGCSSEGERATNEPSLQVQQVNYWSMPSEGTSIPAPRGMTVGPNEEVYVLDNAGRVLVFDKDGKVQKRWKMPEYDVGKPEGICVFQDGRVAVADTHYNRIVLFDQNGTVLETLGELGEQPGQFVYPVAIAQDAQENFYVGEYGNNDRVQKFSVDGQFLLEFGDFGTEAGHFQRASGLVWRDGKVYVTDAFNNRVQVFSDSGEFLEILGDSEHSTSLHYPYDIAGDAAGVLYVVEYGAGRVSQLDLSGKLLGRFGTIGSGDDQLRTPWGLAVGPPNRVLVADTGNRRIVELRL